MRQFSYFIKSRRGQSLVEFAVVALVLYMLLAAILTFGHMLYVAQGLQACADLAAREISRTPLPAMATFQELLDDEATDGYEDLRLVYNEDLLVFDLDTLPVGQSFFDFIADNDWPIVNRQLATLMIVDRPDLNGDGTPDRNFIRYPGALLSDPDTPSGFTVGIPLVETRGVNGVETIRWVRVVEPINSDEDQFAIRSDGGGIVALRINYPFQSASMSSFQPNPAGLFEPTIGDPNFADDESITETNESDRPGALTGAPLTDGENYAGTYGGQFGLGAQGAQGQIVRPYRRVISAQAIYRRELFQ